MDKFYVNHENMGDEWKPVLGFDFEDAAEVFAEDYDCDGDYTLSAGNTTKILVKDENNTIKKFSISAEHLTHYRAIEV